jgi:uncharacterized protein (TIGR03067 family)
MYRYGILLLTMALAPADAPRGQEVQKTLDRLQGTWQAVSGERDGRRLEADQVKQLRLVFTNDRFHFSSRGGKETAVALVGKESHEGKFRVNPAGAPKAIDLLPATGPQQERVLPGIYLLEKDNALTLCWREQGKERPKGFATKPKDDLVLLVFQREEPK